MGINGDLKTLEVVLQKKSLLKQKELVANLVKQIEIKEKGHV